MTVSGTGILYQIPAKSQPVINSIKIERTDPFGKNRGFCFFIKIFKKNGKFIYNSLKESILILLTN
jgi:hypothetical protein